MLELSEHLRESLPRGEEFGAIMRLDGQVFREQKNRRTFRTQIGSRTYFVKIHRPTSWREILKNALRGRWPVLTAKPEWLAIQALERLGIPTVHAAGFGCRGQFPHALESFIITDELGGMIHLNELPDAASHASRASSKLKRCGFMPESRRLSGSTENRFRIADCGLSVASITPVAAALETKIRKSKSEIEELC